MSVSPLYLQVNTAKFLDIFNLAGVCMWLSRQKAKESGYLYLIYYIKTLKCGQVFQVVFLCHISNETKPPLVLNKIHADNCIGKL